MRPASLALQVRRGLLRALCVGAIVVVVLLLGFDRLSGFPDWGASRRLLVTTLVGLPLGLVVLPVSVAEEVLGPRLTSTRGRVAELVGLVLVAAVTALLASLEASYVLVVAFQRSLQAGLQNVWWLTNVHEDDLRFLIALLWILATSTGVAVFLRARGLTLPQQLWAGVVLTFFLSSPSLVSFGSVEDGFAFELSCGVSGALGAGCPVALLIADSLDARLVKWLAPRE